jgi:hypothetical protein
MLVVAADDGCTITLRASYIDPGKDVAKGHLVASDNVSCPTEDVEIVPGGTVIKCGRKNRGPANLTLQTTNKGVSDTQYLSGDSFVQFHYEPRLDQAGYFCSA